MVIRLLLLLTLLVGPSAARPAAPPEWLPTVPLPGVDARAIAAAAPPAALPPLRHSDIGIGWDAPARGWVAVALRAIRIADAPPTRAARALALLSIGMDTALAGNAASRSSGRDASDAAALAGVAPALLRASLPLLADEPLLTDARDAALSAALASGASPSSAARGLTIGEATAIAVLRAVADDGAARAPRAEDDRSLAAPGRWSATPPMMLPGLDPQWGDVRPLLAAPLAEAAPPPAWDSQAFASSRASFAQTASRLTPDDRKLAQRYAFGMRSVTPPGAWFQTASDLLAAHPGTLRHEARVFAALGATLNDAIIGCWRAKYRYRVARPIQWMRQRDQAWLPALTDTPPHPSYPSGHATIGGAASTVLALFFPEARSSLTEMAEAGARSRILGGIHWPIDSDAGLDLGRRAAERSIVALNLGAYR